MRRSVFAIGLLSIAYSAAGVELPAVPLSVVDVDKEERLVRPAGKGERRDPGRGAVAELAASAGKGETGRMELKATPGVNEIVTIAIGHLNRIVTPFESPEVYTTSQAVTRISGNIVYVGTNTVAPVGLYITDKTQGESEAISVTLIPKKIPPRELRFHLQAQPTGGGVRARRWEESQPYIGTIRDLFRALALRQLPSGYDFRGQPPLWLPPCAPPNESGQIHFDFTIGQSLVGHHLEVVIGVVKNQGDRAVELQEVWCAGEGIAAVAFWPRNLLEPGQASEIFVAKRREAPAPRPTRPSLISGSHE
jgi:conjugal transfer pilus assembly protein TraK